MLIQFNSKFTTYKIPPGVYTFKDLSIVLSRGFKNGFQIRGRMRPNHEHDLSDSIIIDSDNVSLITKLKLGPRIMVLRFVKKSFFNTTLGFTPYWVYKDFGIDFYSESNRNLTVTDKIHLKCDVIDGSVLNGVRQPILFSFALDKKPDFKVFCEPEAIHYKKN